LALNRRGETHGKVPMSRTFNFVMRIVSSLIGVVMILIGTVWILQGLNPAALDKIGPGLLGKVRPSE
jgi:hypothetical protein